MRRVSTGWCCILSMKWYTTKLSLEEAPALQSKPNQSRPKHFIGKDWDHIKANLCTAVAKLSKVESRTKPKRGSLHLVNIWKTKNLNVVIFWYSQSIKDRTCTIAHCTWFTQMMVLYYTNKWLVIMLHLTGNSTAHAVTPHQESFLTTCLDHKNSNNKKLPSSIDSLNF